VLNNETGEDFEDPDILAGNTTLRFLQVIESNHDIASTPKSFGNLGHLAVLTTISLHFNHGFDVVLLNAEE
jgi:hypothetical protein